MFAVKSMDVNSNLLRLKLDMVYRDLPLEEARTRFEEITATVVPKEPEQTAGKRKKTVKPIPRKSK
jgi:hypothetical protein